MSSGRPDYQRLYQLGKLPPEMRVFVPGLKESDEKEQELKKLKESMCDECKNKLLGSNLEVLVKCESCEFEAQSKSALKRHVTMVHK